MFASNCWYVVATSSELATGQPLAVEIADQPLVLYRRGSDGAPVALDDRCAHRLAPLSLGQVDGDTLRCMYHGVRFDAAGRCIEVPGQAGVPERFVQRRYAAVEQQGWIWLWLGDPAAADRSLLPATESRDRARWHLREGSLQFDVDHRLVSDNLCDLSHVGYVHAATLGQLGEEAWGRQRATVRELPRGLRSERWMVDTPVPLIQGLPERVDAFIAYDYVLPGVFLMVTTMHPAGTAAALDHGSPAALKPLHKAASAQAVTPVSQGRCRYFFGASVAIEEPQERTDLFYALIHAAFEEDRRMLEAQQRMVARSPQRALSATVHDAGTVRFRRLYEGQGAFQ